ncbi:hypothetical protein NDU88_001343 [Pleurodeles waltl]|uniref:Uncharacterized protein n=1 Tax=Pleurodeles waltl TaxID=8319 RepID=A0AAV7VW66_PLEWA|nr:hypothetical protein NDU88_001343 [Pleurodeles waltl]
MLVHREPYLPCRTLQYWGSRSIPSSRTRLLPLGWASVTEVHRWSSGAPQQVPSRGRRPGTPEGSPRPLTVDSLHFRRDIRGAGMTQLRPLDRPLLPRRAASRQGLSDRPFLHRLGALR